MVQIRPGTQADYERLQRIQRVALPEFAPELLDAAIAGTVGLLVAVEPDPVGYTLFMPAGKQAVLLEIAVDPPRQGEGIGSDLLEATISRLEGGEHESVRLTARQSDERVHEFYERHGFEQNDEIAGFFESDDGLVFVREL